MKLATSKNVLSWRVSLAFIFVIASLIYGTGLLSPPSLMDDTDAVEAQIARNMLTSGDYVTARIDGVAYLEKSPLSYWLTDIAYKLFGVHDWSSRIPFALTAIALALLTAAFARWAFGARSGLCAGLVMGTCVGLWIFTRILIPDVMLTFVIALAMWSFLRALDDSEPHPALWSHLFFACLALGLLLKSLIGVVFPIGAAVLFLAFTRQLFSRAAFKGAWKKLHPVSGIALLLLIALPWHILATLRNPPWFAWTLKSMPGHYHGFLWFYLVNEQLLRFLNLRYPRDYDTVPRIWFWLFHLIWLFPWSVYLPAAAKLSFPKDSRAARTRLLALCWIGLILVFFTFSTTQEYYSMPCYPAFALLLGAVMPVEDSWVRNGTRALGLIAGAAALACFSILIADRHLPTPGDITAALTVHPSSYRLSLGHMQDLTLSSFAYLRTPLAFAGVAFLLGSFAAFATAGKKLFPTGYLAVAAMMVLFFQGAHLAMIRFDPLLSSRDIARFLHHAPSGQIVVDRNYYWFSSIPFYTGRPELLLNGNWNNLEYGSNAPGVPDVFLTDDKLKTLWSQPARYYLLARANQLTRFQDLLGKDRLQIVDASGGKLLMTNPTCCAATP